MGTEETAVCAQILKSMLEILAVKPIYGVMNTLQSKILGQ